MRSGSQRRRHLLPAGIGWSGARRSLPLLLAVALVPIVVLVPHEPADAASCSPTLTEIACENQLPGTPPSVWDLDGATDASIVGFATQISVQAGDTVRFKIRSDASSYAIRIYRLGYYQGNGAREVASISPTASLPQSQPSCLTVASTGLIDCGNWAESARWTVPTGSMSGLYLAHLVRPDNGDDSHIAFVVRNDASRADLLFQTSDTTWQAYNDFGGNSLYRGAPAGRSYKVSYNRPFATRETTPSGRDWLMANEYPMIRWLERNGYDVTYQTGVDTDRSGSLLTNHRAFLSVGHDEYWSGAQRAAVEAARDAGVHLAFFSGNEVYWKTRWESSIDGSGTAHRTMVTYKETWDQAKIDPSPTWTGTWRDPRFSPPSDGGRPENELSGSWYRVQAYVGSLQVPEAQGKLRLWRNTSVATQAPGQTATVGAGTLGYEFNETPDNGFQPAGLVRLSDTTVAVPEYLTDWGSRVAPNTATHHLTLYRAPSGALVFGAGTIQWAWGLDANHDGAGSAADPRIQQATLNILADMGAQPSTRQSGLVAATATTDTGRPTATITSPSAGAVVTGGQVVTVSGTATDAGGGAVGAVEVSVDGGQTWRTANGRASWSFAWMPTGSGPTTVQARAADDSGNLQSVPDSVTVDARCPCTLLGNAVPDLEAESTDTNAVSVGMRFRSDVAGTVTGVRFFKGPGNTGTHIGSLWTAGGTRLAQATFTSESASGWQLVTFASPVAIQAGQSYVVSYYAPNGRYAVDRNAFQRAGVDRPPLHAPADGDGGENGLYAYGNNVFPDQSYESENYWVDVVFAPSGTTPGDLTPPTATVVSPAAGATGVGVGSAAVAQFSEPVQASTIAMGIVGPTGAVAGSVAYDATLRRATFTPSSPLVAGSVHTVTVSAASDVAGNPLAVPLSWTFTTAGTAPPPTCPCTVFPPTATPAVVSEPAPNPVSLGMRVRSDVTGSVTGVRFYKGPTNTGTHTGSLWRDDGVRLATVTFAGESATGWQQADFATPVPIEAGRTYVVSYFAPNGGYSYTAGQFAGSGVDRGPLHAPADGDGGGNGLYVYGADARPTETWNATNYWVDIVFSTSVVPGDTTPPTASVVSPVAGATGVSSSTTVVAELSEPVQSGTIQMDLSGPSGIVTSTVLYDPTTRRATLTPTSALAAGSTYTARVTAASDVAGNPLASPLSWSFTTAVTAPPPTCPCTVFASTATPAVVSAPDARPVSLGMRVRSDVAGPVTGVRFYKGPTNTGTHTGSLWRDDGVRLATATFTGESASGWQQANFATPVLIEAGRTYVVSYFAPNGGYSYTAGQFAGSGVDRGPLHAPANGDGGGNGLYVYGADALPTRTWNATNYWVDLVFGTGTGPPPTPPTVVPGSASVVEGDAGTRTLQVPVTLSAPSSAEVTVAWSTLPVPSLTVPQAAPGSDYTASSGVVTFAPGQTTATVSVPVLGDTLDEADEILVVSFREATNAVIGGFWGLGFGSIVDDDP